MSPKSVSIPLRTAQSKGLTKSDAELARLARALGHPARVAILRRLFRAGACLCGEIVDLLPLAQATVSQHLKALREAGWIEGETRGTRICYGAVPGTAATFRKLFHEVDSQGGTKS